MQNSSSRQCCVLDIETQPDRFARILAGRKVLKAASPLHEIVNISALRLDIDDQDAVTGVHLQTWNRAEYTEADILRNAGLAIDGALSSHGQLVTYNGRRFDLPMIRLRQMRWWQPSHDVLHSTRFKSDHHCDVMEELAGGLGQMPSLVEACAMLGFALKGPMRLASESDVAPEIEKCEIDVIGTAILYLYCRADRTGRSGRLKGNLMALGSYLRAIAGRQPHLLRFGHSPLLGEDAAPWGSVSAMSPAGLYREI